MPAISVNSLHGYFFVGALIIGNCLFCENGEAQTLNPTREIEARVQALENLVKGYRYEIEPYKNEVNILSNRMTALETTSAISREISGRLLAYGVVDDDSIRYYCRPALAKSSPATSPVSSISVIETINIAKERPGSWTMTFVPSLKSKPVVIVSPGENLAAPNQRVGSASISELSESGFKVRTSVDGSSLNDIEFSFLVLSSERQ